MMVEGKKQNYKSEFSLPVMCDRMNMNMICWYLCVTSQNHIVKLFREATATHSSKSISVSLTW